MIITYSEETCLWWFDHDFSYSDYFKRIIFTLYQIKIIIVFSVAPYST